MSNQSTDVATREDRPVIESAPMGSVGGNLIREAVAVMADADKLSKALANTSMIPVHFKGKPDEITAAILYGAALGLDPMAALRGIYVVHGNPAIYARTMSAIVQRDGHRIWTVESTPERVVVAGQRRGSDHVEECVWTIERAQTAGYTSNAKYKTNPQEMLYAKAVTEVCRRIAPDSLNGIYAVEEYQLEPVQATVTPRRATAGAFAVTAAPSEPAETGEAPTKTAKGRMFAAFGPAGFDSEARSPEGKAARLGYMSRVLGREVESSADLTAADVDLVTDALVEDAARAGADG